MQSLADVSLRRTHQKTAAKNPAAGCPVILKGALDGGINFLPGHLQRIVMHIETPHTLHVHYRSAAHPTVHLAQTLTNKFIIAIKIII